MKSFLSDWSIPLLTAEQDKMLRNISILVVVILIIIAALVYNRYRIKTELSKLLLQRNALIESRTGILNPDQQKAAHACLAGADQPSFCV